MKIYIRASAESVKRISNIDDLVEELESLNYSYYGLRGATNKDMSLLSRGYLDFSTDWDFEYDRPSGEELDGTSALVVSDTMTNNQILKVYNRAKTMYGKTGVVLLIGGEYSDYGDDEDEIIISQGSHGADVVAIVEI